MVMKKLVRVKKKNLRKSTARKNTQLLQLLGLTQRGSSWLAATLDNILTHTFVILLLETNLLPFCREMKRRCLWKCARIVSNDLHIHTHVAYNQCHLNGIRPAVYEYIQYSIYAKTRIYIFNYLYMCKTRCFTQLFLSFYTCLSSRSSSEKLCGPFICKCNENHAGMIHASLASGWEEGVNQCVRDCYGELKTKL